MLEGFLQSIQKSPLIAAVRDRASTILAAQSGAAVVFLLGGSIMDLPDSVKMLHDHGKIVFAHLDLCAGLGKDAEAVEWCASQARPDGLISTRAPMLRAASELKLLTIQRLFLMDSVSLQNGIRLLKSKPPDMVEVLPGLVPKAIRQLSEALKRPIIAGGMVTEPDEVRRALAAGAVAVSTGAPALWGAHP